MTRTKTNPSIDRQLFSRTARRTKSINLGLLNFRGGIRF